MLVAGGVLAWLGLIPLLASLVPPDAIATQLVKLGYLKDLGHGNWTLVFWVLAAMPLFPAALMISIWNARPKGAK